MSELHIGSRMRTALRDRYHVIHGRVAALYLLTTEMTHLAIPIENLIKSETLSVRGTAGQRETRRIPSPLASRPLPRA